MPPFWDTLYIGKGYRVSHMYKGVFEWLIQVVRGLGIPAKGDD